MNEDLAVFSGAKAAACLRTPDGELLWGWIGFAFMVYWFLFTWGSLSGARELNTVGGILILAVLAWAVLERLWVRVDAVVPASIAAMLIPLVHQVAGDGTQSGQAIFKHESVFAVIAISRLLCLPTVSRSKLRWMLAVPVLIVLLLSLLVDRGRSGGASRHSGLFGNPNNLALIPFLLLFLVDEERDPLPLRIVVHAIVAAVLALSGTSGAIIAYGIGLGAHLKGRLSPAVRLIVLTVLLAGGSASTFLILKGNSVLPETRLTTQLALMRSQVGEALGGGTLRYYDEERLMGEGATSGVWRLAHWRRTVETYADGTLTQQLFGFGTGSSTVLLGILPHNEYLRILFEQGLAGLLLFLFVWRRLLMTAPKPVRYLGFIIAIYSFSENNLDNFPFMSLFILFLSATGPAVAASVPDGLRRSWQTSDVMAPAFRITPAGEIR